MNSSKIQTNLATVNSYLIDATISFGQQTYSANEDDEKVEPVLVLSNPSSSVITLQVIDTRGSATGKYVQLFTIIMDFVGGGVDYNSGPYSVQFNVGVTRVLLTVSIHDDNILEGNETFNLSIGTSSLPSRVTVGNPGETMVTILANDGK